MTLAPTSSTRGAGRLRRTSVIVLAPAALLVHVLDEHLWHRTPGTGSAGVGSTVVIVSALLLLGVLRWTPPAVRHLVLLTAGSVAAAGGVMHVLHALLVTPTGADVTGLLAGLAGLVSVAAALVGQFGRPHRSWRSPGAWLRRVAVGVVWLTFVPVVLVPVVVGVVQTHTPVVSAERWQVPGAQAVRFTSSDGVALRGQYVPSRNGAAVVLVSSARGERTATMQHARLLAAHGYGVLAYDARGTGASEGRPNGYGWGWDHDVHGAVTFLQSRPDVTGRTGVLGLSTGADVALEAAASDHRIRAVVADGATGRTPEDIVPHVAQDPLGWVYAQALFTSVGLWSGSRPPAPLVDVVEGISPGAVLYIAAGSIPVELTANRRYAAATREPVSLWELPDVAHTRGIVQARKLYEQTVVDFLDHHLR